MKGVECLQLSRAPMIDPALPRARLLFLISSVLRAIQDCPRPPHSFACFWVQQCMTLSQKREEKKNNLLFHSLLMVAWSVVTSHVFVHAINTGF